MTSAGRKAVLLALCLVSAGCKRAEERAPEGTAASPAAASASATAPKDTLGPDEVTPGDVEAFGIRLPRGFVRVAAYPDEVKAQGRLPLRLVRKYLEERVRDGTLDTSQGELLFDKVRVRENPVRDLAIRVYYAKDGSGTRIEVRDLTRPPPPDLPNDEARFRAAGFRRDGQLLDPQHTE